MKERKFLIVRWTPDCKSVEYLTGFKEIFSPHINEAKKFKNEHEPLAIATRLLKNDKTHLYFLLDVDV